MSHGDERGQGIWDRLGGIKSAPPIATNGFYTMLTRLEHKRLIRSPWVDGGEGRARHRYYAVTKAGQQTLIHVRQLLSKSKY